MGTEMAQMDEITRTILIQDLGRLKKKFYQPDFRDLYDDKRNYHHVIQLLENRGVTIESIAELVYDRQRKYTKDLSMTTVTYMLYEVLQKREVQNTIMMGIAIDVATEQGAFAFDEDLNNQLVNDKGTFGLDEVLAESISHTSGSIGLSNAYGLDISKQGIIAKLNEEQGIERNGVKVSNTFIDDLVAHIAGATMARIAHKYQTITDMIEDLNLSDADYAAL